MRAVGGILTLGLVALLTVGCSDSPTSSPVTTPGDNTNPGSVQDPIKTETPGVELYSAVLTGAQEVPAVETMASGSTSFHMSSDGTSIIYAITVSNISDVTDAHIHVGGPGEVGPPVIDLFDGTKSGTYDGLLVQGRIGAGDLVGELAGHTMADLHALLKSGRAYVNVHTAKYPAGEIRGQVTVAPADDEEDT